MTNEEAKAFLDNLKICIDEHPVVADWLVEIANRKTESNSEIPNNCETCTHWEFDAKYKWWHCPLQDNGMYECHYEPRKLTAVEDEPQTEREGE